MRLDAKTRCLLRGIEMGNQTEARTLLGARACGNPGGHIRMVRHRHVAGTHPAQLFRNHLRQVKLNFR